MVIGHELVADPDWLNFFATHPQFVLDRLLIFDDIIPEDAVSIFVRQYAAATQEDVDAFLQALSQLEDPADTFTARLDAAIPFLLPIEAKI